MDIVIFVKIGQMPILTKIIFWSELRLLDGCYEFKFKWQI